MKFLNFGASRTSRKGREAGKITESAGNKFAGSDEGEGALDLISRQVIKGILRLTGILGRLS